MTNGERIRSVSDQGLACILCDLVQDCYLCPGNDLCNYADGRANGILKWLKMPEMEVRNNEPWSDKI